MGFVEYLNLSCEEVTSEVYDVIIDFLENEQNVVAFEQLWESSEEELPSKQSRAIWETIITKVETTKILTAERQIKAPSTVTDMAWKVA